MYRWMEQFEMKHAEFERTISFFNMMATTWSQLAQKASQPGFVAYANRHAAMYTDLTNDADIRYKQIGHPDFINLREGRILADAVAEWRTRWLAWMGPLVC